MSNFNAAVNFQKGKVKGNLLQDLNQYRCPDCNSPFFFKGQQDYINYVQCVKSHCLRIDLLPSHDQLIHAIENLPVNHSITIKL